MLEPEILQEARLDYEAVLNSELLLPRLGIDESGKGVFFGPLCVADVYVNEKVVNARQDAGIRDSKNISSDQKIGELAELIRETPSCVTSVVPIGNEAYNRLYAKMKRVNTLFGIGSCAGDRKSDGLEALHESAAAGSGVGGCAGRKFIDGLRMFDIESSVKPIAIRIARIRIQCARPRRLPASAAQPLQAVCTPPQRHRELLEPSQAPPASI